jgi:ATP-dependent RNA helicase HelY
VLLGRLDEARRAAHAAQDRNLDALRPGDVVMAPRRGGRAVVLKQERGRSGNRVLALTQQRTMVRLTPDDFPGPIRRVASVELPRPFAPRSPGFQRATAALLRRLPDADPTADDADARVEQLQAEVHAHPLHGAPGADAALRGAFQAERIGREVDRLERRIAGRTETLARQFDRVLAVLESWGYVRDWELLPGGYLLSRLNTESDLVVAESVRTGLLDDVEPAALAAIVSCFVYQRRGPDGDEPMPPRRWPAQIVRKRVGEIERIWRDLHLTERDQRLRETRRPDPGFTAAIHAWAEGDDLGDILEEEEMTGGDFVRNVKQVIDLLRQLAEVAPESATARAAHQAADRCRRGVVAASSTVTVPAA